MFRWSGGAEIVVADVGLHFDHAVEVLAYAKSSSAKQGHAKRFEWSAIFRLANHRRIFGDVRDATLWVVAISQCISGATRSILEPISHQIC